MKIIIGILVILSSSLFAGFFSNSLVETVDIDGKELRIFSESDSEYGADYFIFQDTLSIRPNQKNFRPTMPDRMDKVFNKINSFGKERGYTSFVIVNNGTSFFEGFPINNREDLKTLCFYDNYCGLGTEPIFKDARVFRFKIVYFKEKNLNYFQVQ